MPVTQTQVWEDFLKTNYKGESWQTVCVFTTFPDPLLATFASKDTTAANKAQTQSFFSPQREDIILA